MAERTRERLTVRGRGRRPFIATTPWTAAAVTAVAVTELLATLLLRGTADLGLFLIPIATMLLSGWLWLGLAIRRGE